MQQIQLVIEELVLRKRPAQLEVRALIAAEQIKRVGREESQDEKEHERRGPAGMLCQPGQLRRSIVGALRQRALLHWECLFWHGDSARTYLLAAFVRSVWDKIAPQGEVVAMHSLRLLLRVFKHLSLVAI